MPTHLYEFKHEEIACRIHSKIRDPMDTGKAIDILARALADYERQQKAKAEREIERLRAEVVTWQRQQKAMERIFACLMNACGAKLSTNEAKQALRSYEQSQANAAREKKRQAAKGKS